MAGLDTLEFQVLDALANGPSSVAGIYGDLVYLRRHDAVGLIEHLRRALDALETKGWAVARLMTSTGAFEKVPEEGRSAKWAAYQRWLPNAQRDELAIDEIGFWYRLTPLGREAWVASAGEPADDWELDDNVVTKVITIVAADVKTAEKILAQWISTRPTIQARERHHTEPHEARLRNGRVLPSGVRLTCRYAPKESSRGQV
jgi:hypothetical protein